MNAVALALLTLGADPLPDRTSPVDSLVYSFGRSGGPGTVLAAFGGGSLRIAKDGKVTYFYSSDPHTGSGGRVVRKNWELTADESKELFAKMVADGLLADDTGGRLHSGDVQVTSGRWRTDVAAAKVPNAMRHLRPLLTKVDSRLWPEPAPAPREVKPKPAALGQFNYWFAPKAEGDNVLLYLGRDGAVSYQRYSSTGQLTKTHVQTAWTIPAAEAAERLDAIAARGVLSLEDTGSGKHPVHRFEAVIGRWHAVFYVAERPEVVTKQLLPLMKKADPEFWK